MSVVYDRLSPGAGAFYFDRLVDAVGVPRITSLSAVTDGSAITITGTSFSASGNTAFIAQGATILQLPVATEGTTSIVTSALNCTGLYITQPISVYVINASAAQSNSVAAFIAAKAGESATAIAQDFLGDPSTRAEASPDLALTDEVRLKSVVGGVIGGVTMTGQGAFKAASGITSVQYAVFDGSLLSPYVAMNWADPPNTAIVPDEVGRTLADAITDLNGVGLVGTVVNRVQNVQYAAGVVIAQFPARGQALVLGGTVELTLSLGATQTLVPPMIGLLDADAEAARAAALLVGGVQLYIDGFNTDRVLNQSVEAGEVVAVGSAVDIVISSNLAPSVIGEQFSDAASDLTNYNLTLNDAGTTYEYNRRYGPGVVLRQKPLPGDRVQPLDAFSLVVSLGNTAPETLESWIELRVASKFAEITQVYAKATSFEFFATKQFLYGAIWVREKPGSTRASPLLEVNVLTIPGAPPLNRGGRRLVL